MAQEQNSTSTTSNSSNRKPSVPSFRKTQKPTAPTSKGGNQTRNEKRRRWAKKHKPTPKAVVVRGPVKEYVTACCNVLGKKPKAGEKVITKNPESGKTESTAKGLGKWRCSNCGKPAKVTPRKPEVKEIISAEPVASFVSPTNVV